YLFSTSRLMRKMQLFSLQDSAAAFCILAVACLSAGTVAQAQNEDASDADTSSAPQDSVGDPPSEQAPTDNTLQEGTNPPVTENSEEEIGTLETTVVRASQPEPEPIPQPPAPAPVTPPSPPEPAPVIIDDEVDEV